eukprot:m.457128 g.457128  ORF g.457128 m.457128 type:complete len:180 (+) comp21205_c0_seq1:100-639(+)
MTRLSGSAGVLRDGSSELASEANNRKADIADGGGDEDAEDGDEDDDEDDAWSAKELSLLPNILGILKVALNTASKSGQLLGTIKSDVDPTVFDSLPEIGEGMCADSDDLICASYAPIDLPEVARLAASLRAKCEAMLSVNKTILGLASSAEVPSWVALLERAAEHNEVKLRTALEGHGA